MLLCIRGGRVQVYVEQIIRLQIISMVKYVHISNVTAGITAIAN